MHRYSLLCSTVVFCLVQNIFTAGDRECDIVINELNSDDIGIEFCEFVELRSVCVGSAQPSLRSYLLIIVKEYDKTLDGPAVTFSADLYHSSFKPGSPYFVIGSPNAELKDVIDLPFTKDTVMFYRKGQLSGQGSITGFFKKKDAPAAVTNVITNGNDSPMAAILLKDDDQSRETGTGISKLRLSSRDPRSRRTRTIPHLKITDDLAELIKGHIHDIVIYSRRSIFNKCGFFEKIVSPPTTQQYDVMLPAREWDRIRHDDLSINRCTLAIPGAHRKFFQFGSWKIGKRTPGAQNDCSGDRYIIEDQLQQILAPQGIDIHNLPPQPAVHVPQQCSSSTRVAAMVAVNRDSEAVADNRDAAIAMASASSCVGTEEEMVRYRKLDGLVDHLSDVVNTLKRQADQTQRTESPVPKIQCVREGHSQTEVDPAVRPWDDPSHFTEAWIDQIKEHQSTIIKTDWFTPERKTWLSYIFNADNPTQSRFRCRFCSEYANEKHFSHNLPVLAEQDGYFVANSDTMYDRIQKHTKLSFHIKSVEHTKAKYAKSMEQCLSRWQRNVAETATANEIVTARMCRTVYTEIKTNIPLDAHSVIVNLQKINGIDLGVHHYERTSATRMMKVIASTMKSSLVDFIQGSTGPLSILVDTTTDSSVINYLSVYVRALENNIPRCYFYNLTVVKSETAESLKNLIIKSFKDDGIWDAVKARLVGFASDGASVMTGRQGGLGKLIEMEVGRDIYRIHCAAHKLQLALGHAFDAEPFQFVRNVLEVTVNSVYTFYNRNAVKRKASLRETAEILEEKYYELNYIFKVRWVASEWSALHKLNQSYLTVLSNMETIISSTSEFDSDTRNTAKGIYNNLINVRFYSNLLFTMDVLENAKQESLYQQNTHAVVIGMEKRRQELIRSMTNLKTTNGPAVGFFLQHSKCQGDAGELRKCTVSDLDTRNFQLKYGDTKFMLTQHNSRHGHGEFPPLSKFRADIIGGINRQIDKYYPEGSMAMFDVLMPSNLPATTGDTFVYAPKIYDLAEKLGLDKQRVSTEFQMLLKSLMLDNNVEYCAHKAQNDPIGFWSHFLNSKTVEWGERIRSAVEKTLCLPIATADVERGFSILEHTRYDRRSRLTPSNLRDILFIRINGPQVDAFDAIRYAKAWIRAGGMRTDDPRKQRHAPKNELPRSNLF